MKIVHEKIGKESFLELSVTPKEYEMIKEYFIISKKIDLQGEEINVGIKMDLNEEFSDKEDKIYF